MAGNYTYDPKKRIFCGNDDDGNAILIQGDRAFEFIEAVENHDKLVEKIVQVDEAIIEARNDIEEVRCIKADQDYVDTRIYEASKYINKEVIANIAEEVVRQYFFDLIEKRRSKKLENASVADEELFELLDILNITEDEQ
jgi:hypothetical protein